MVWAVMRGGFFFFEGSGVTVVAPHFCYFLFPMHSGLQVWRIAQPSLYLRETVNYLAGYGSEIWVLTVLLYSV